MRNGIVHRTLTFLCIYHQKKASKLRISMLSLNAFFLIILLLLLFMSVLDNIYFSRFIDQCILVGRLMILRAYKNIKGRILSSTPYILYHYFISLLTIKTIPIGIFTFPVVILSSKNKSFS